LPVSIALAQGQSISPEILPYQLDVFYSHDHGYQLTVGYARSEGQTNYETTNEQRLAYGPIQNPPERTYAGNHLVQVSYDDGNVACYGSATLVVAKGQLSDFLRVPQNQAFDYVNSYAASWPNLYGVEVNSVYHSSYGINVAIDAYGQSYSAGYSFSLDFNNLLPDGWISGGLNAYQGNYDPWNPSYNYYPSLSATMNPSGGPMGNNPGGYPEGGGGNLYPYSLTISTPDPNLEGTISVPFGIRQAYFWPEISGSSHEFDGNARPLNIRSSSSPSPWSVNVWNSWQNYYAYHYYSKGPWEYWYDEGGNFYWGYRYTPSGGNQPILPPGNWSLSVYPGGWDSYNFEGGGWGTVDISKKSIAFRIDQPFSEGNAPSGPSSFQQTDGSTSIPVILSGAVIYDQYGRSISAGAQSYGDGYSNYYSGTTPPSIRVVYKNNSSNAETGVEYQVPSSAIPQYDNSGTAMVADLVYTPIESQPLPPGEYSIRVELIEPEKNATNNFGQGSDFFDYFHITNVSTPLATLIVASADSTPLLLLYWEPIHWRFSRMEPTQILKLQSLMIWMRLRQSMALAR